MGEICYLVSTTTLITFSRTMNTFSAPDTIVYVSVYVYILVYNPTRSLLSEKGYRGGEEGYLKRNRYKSMFRMYLNLATPHLEGLRYIDY